MRLWVADTSPLIFLAKLNRLDLLKRGADPVGTLGLLLAAKLWGRSKASEMNRPAPGKLAFELAHRFALHLSSSESCRRFAGVGEEGP